MADEVSKTGVYIDTKSGKVVEKQPEEGIQLVAAGGTIDAALAAVIEEAKAAAAGSPAEPKTITTDSVATKSRRV